MGWEDSEGGKPPEMMVLDNGHRYTVFASANGFTAHPIPFSITQNKDDIKALARQLGFPSCGCASEWWGCDGPHCDHRRS